ncbi:MAG: hypothetical protein A3I05_07480 [Deltaproteobacteria bacterium RIFCSPLOWO2_02_FULL_44_10]|nr:MAG: hypothetical protein A3C46_00510 [Deltaproteobacteria bacterium RIFCSPHIGHO2_02_FULL_44_16]OGQ47368.1 MAG: hypothetical protein A3I05_07480 [Deltaproteobacteria bacterium RIFCSPLOWO2_02_FULL_44_10]
MKKRPYFYFGMTLVLAFAIFIFERPDLFTGKEERQLLEKFDAHNVEKIEFEHFIGGIQLKREGEGWKVAKFTSELEKQVAVKEGISSSVGEPEWVDADTARVHQALGVFGDLPQGILVSANPSKQMEYQVGVTGQKLKFYDRDGKLLASLIIGKNGPDFVSNYVRYEGKDEVYLVNKSLQGIFSPSVDDFRPEKSASSAGGSPSETSDASGTKQ